MRKILFLFILLNLITATNGDSFFLGTEFPFDTTAYYMTETHTQQYPEVAFDGTNYFVVWQDYRNGSDYDIYGARIDTTGEVLDRVGIPICTEVQSQYYPTVAFDGTNFFVVWRDRRIGQDYKVYGARVSPSGIVLDIDGIPICTTPDDKYYPKVGFNGTCYLVVWYEYYGAPDYDIYGARVDTDGTPLDPEPIPICTVSNYQYRPSVSSDGTNFLVTWYDQRTGNYDIYGARIDNDGTVLDTAGIVISDATNSQYYPRVAFDGTNYFVVWYDYRSGNYDIYGARVDTAGAVLDGTGIAIFTGGAHDYRPTIAFDGNNYFVAWYYNNDIYGTRMDTAGTVLDPAGITISTAANNQQYPTVAGSGENWISVWSDYRNGNWDIYGARVDTAGVLLDSTGISVSTVGNTQSLANACFDGLNYLAVWQDNRFGNNDYNIYGARADTSGAVLDFPAIPICTTANHQYYPAVGFDGTNYLVVWYGYPTVVSGYEIWGRRVDKSGVVVDTIDIEICVANNNQQYPKVGFDGNNYLVVWEDERSGEYDIYGSRVDTSGAVLDTIVICDQIYDQYNPAIYFDGEDYLIVWTDYRNGTDKGDIYGARIDTAGTVLGEIEISCAVMDQRDPELAFDGENYFVVWEDWREGVWSVYGTRVSKTGVVLDGEGIPIANLANSGQSNPTVVFDGTDYIVFWQDLRSFTYYDVYAARVDTAGVVHTPDGVIFTDSLSHQHSPLLVQGSDGQLLAVYQNFDADYSSYRIYGELFRGSDIPITGVETDRVVEGSRLKVVKLMQNYPNPFNSTTVIKYIVPGVEKSSNLSLKIYDASGRLARTFPITDNRQPITEMVWNGCDDSGDKLSNGIYFYRIEMGKYSATRKMILIR